MESAVRTVAFRPRRRRPAMGACFLLAALCFGGCFGGGDVDPRPGRGEAFVQEGHASWYGEPFHGRKTASGETYDMNDMTVAHRTLPFGTVVEIENLDNGKTAAARVTDRGPFIAGRILDGSRAVARELEYEKTGVARVRIRAHLASGPGDDPARGVWAVQVGAFQDRSNAERLRAEMENRHGAARLVEFGMYTRVWVGACRTEREAEQLRGRLEEEDHLPGFVVRAD